MCVCVCVRECVCVCVCVCVWLCVWLTVSEQLHECAYVSKSTIIFFRVPLMLLTLIHESINLFIRIISATALIGESINLFSWRRCICDDVLIASKCLSPSCCDWWNMPCSYERCGRMWNAKYFLPLHHNCIYATTYLSIWGMHNISYLITRGNTCFVDGFLTLR